MWRTANDDTHRLPNHRRRVQSRFTAVLKNALDSIYREWWRKPVTFVGYGNSGGARAIEQLRQVAIELQMTPLQAAVHLPVEVYLAMMMAAAPVAPELFGLVEKPATCLRDELVWWTGALREARRAS